PVDPLKNKQPTVSYSQSGLAYVNDGSKGKWYGPDGMAYMASKPGDLKKGGAMMYGPDNAARINAQGASFYSAHGAVNAVAAPNDPSVAQQLYKKSKTGEVVIASCFAGAPDDSEINQTGAKGQTTAYQFAKDGGGDPGKTYACSGYDFMPDKTSMYC